MANSFIPKTSTDDSIPTIVAATALDTLIDVAQVPKIVNVDYADEVAEAGDTINIPTRGALSVNDKTAATDITLQAPADSKVAVSLDKHKEVSFGIDGIAKIESRPDHVVGYTRDAALKLAGQVETDLLALADSFSTSVDATAAFARSELLEAQRKMTTNLVPENERKYLIAHPTAIETLLDNDTVSFADRTGDDSVMINGFTDRRFGFDIISSTYVEAGSSPVNYNNLAMARDAMTLVVRPLPIAPAGMGVKQATVTDPTSGLSIRSTMSYNHKALGPMVTLDLLYGVAELRDAFGLWIKT